jgi:PAS domain S-box-containing protein
MSRPVYQQERSTSPTRPVELDLGLYREIFTHSKEAIAIISPEGRYLEQNGAHFNLLHYTDDELKGATPAIHLGEGTFQTIAQQLATTGQYSGEVVSITREGEERNLELSAFAMRNSLGEPLCYVGIKRDITERKRAEAALHQSQQELADFFDNAPIGLHWVGDDGTILRANQSELDLLGYSHDEYVGRNIRDFHCDVEVIEDILNRLANGEVLQDYEARLRCKDGSIRNVRINSSVYRENGTFIHTRCFTYDITDRKLTEKRLALQYAVSKILSRSIDFVDGTHDILQTVCESLGWQVGILWSVDYQAGVLRYVDIWYETSIEVNEFEAASRKRTFEKDVGLPGRVWSTAKSAWIPNVVRDNNFPRATAAAASGLRAAFGFPILLGEEVVGVMEFFSREIRQPDELLLNIIGSLSSQIGQFHELRRAEEKLAQLLVSERSARADSEKANRLKDEFLATLSHELRTPLNAVVGWSRILKSGRLDEESKNHALEVIERNAWAQKQIIEDILDVSRVITGKLQLNFGPVNLATVADAALDALRPAFEAKQIQVESEYQPDLRTIHGDADRLQQVIWNLLSNASKFTPAGGSVRLTISEENGSAQIQVSDSGPGVASDFLPHVFERFTQADGSTTRTHGGLGLGLAIVRHLVELHGGLISADNAGTGGAVFTVTLPIPAVELSKPTETIAQEKLPDITPEILDLADLRILVVEDDIDALDLITLELTDHGALVTAAKSAPDALNLINSTHFDLLISDIGLPETDGYKLIQQIRSRKNKNGDSVPAIALTAYARTADRIRAIAAGYNTHIAKPVETHELVSVVKCLTGRYGNRDEG